MRFIDITQLQLPEGWQDQIDELNESLEGFDTWDEKSAFIDENEVWRDLFVQLSDIGNNKCWYSEARDTMSDRDIDHFRPKKKALNLPGINRSDTDGYWFLAFDSENFRFSSVYSNQRRKDKFDVKKETGGKGVFFPLFEGSIVAKTKVQCEDEEIMLLDPCDPDDVNLITFDHTGKAIPNMEAIDEDREVERVMASIKLYNLDHTTLEELRVRMWNNCQRYIDEIRKITQVELSNKSRTRVRFLKNEIRNLVQKTEEVSAVAIACCEHNGLGMLCDIR